MQYTRNVKTRGLGMAKEGRGYLAGVRCSIFPWFHMGSATCARDIRSPSLAVS
jgi:hypothetical protein